MSIVGQEATQEGALGQSRIVVNQGKELEVTVGTGTDQEENIFQFPFCASIPRGARVSRSPRCLEKEVVVPPILKFDGSVQGPTILSLLSTDSHLGRFEEQRE